MKTSRTWASPIASTLGAVALGASLAVGVAPAQAAKPTPPPSVQQSCSIVSKVITLGHDRWMVKARLYQAGKRYPRHALTLNKIDANGTATPLSTNAGTKKAKWNWRITDVLVAGETLQVSYSGDDSTLGCEGEILTPKLRPRR